MEKHNLQKGQKVYFENEKLPYTVMATSERYAIVVRKLSRRQDADLLWYRVEMESYLSFTEAYEDLKNCPVYSILDFESGMRSSDDYVFGVFDYFKERDCKKAIKYLESGKMDLSRRHEAILNIDKERTK